MTTRGRSRRAPKPPAPGPVAAARAPRGTPLPREPILLPLLLALAAGLVAALPGFRIPFLADDYVFLDAARRVPLPAGLWAPDPIGNFVRPVSRALYFGVLSPLAGGGPMPFHVVNTLLFLAVLALFGHLARLHVGARGALAATAVLAVHFAFDVPLRWVSGSQDLLAIAFALLALVLHAGRRDVLAAIALALALLSKEVVAGTALVAWALAWARGISPGPAARRTVPLFAVTAAWVILWWIARGGAMPAVAAAPGPGEAFTPLVQFARTALGLEALRPHAKLVSTGLLAAGLAVVAAAVATARPAASEKSRDRAAAVEALPPRAKVAGASLLWVACALVPLVPVARIGSAYFYAFAVTGAALALAAGFAAWPRTAVVATVAALALLSQHARRVDVFSAQPDAWAPVSHVNRYYVERAAATTRQLLAGFRTAASPVAPGTLFLFGGLPPFSGFQAGDGAIVRWEMRDTTLRAVYLTDFRRTLVRPGQPVRSLNWRSTFFREVPQRALYLTLGSVLTELGEPVAAKDAFGLSVERDTVVARPYSQEFLGFLAWADGDTAEARRQMTAAGKGTAAIAPPARLDAVRVALARKDSTQAVQAAIAAANDAPFDPGPHRQLVDLALSRPGFVDFAAAQGFALCTIAPRDTATWRRWARVLAARGRVPQGLDAIARFRALAPDSGRGDAEIDSIEARLTRAAASS